MLIARLFPASSFFFCAERWKLDVTFFPRFFASLSLRATYQLEQTRGAAAKIDIVAGSKFSRLHQKTVGIHCVENELPLDMFLSRENKRDWLIMCVDQQQERVVANWFTFKIENIHRVAAQQHAKTANERRCPFFLAHLAAARIEPHHIPDFRTSNPPALEKLWTAEDRMVLPELNQLLRELNKLILFFIALPIEPTDLVVLAVCIVVAVL